MSIPEARFVATHCGRRRRAYAHAVLRCALDPPTESQGPGAAGLPQAHLRARLLGGTFAAHGSQCAVSRALRQHARTRRAGVRARHEGPLQGADEEVPACALRPPPRRNARQAAHSCTPHAPGCGRLPAPGQGLPGRDCGRHGAHGCRHGGVYHQGGACAAPGVAHRRAALSVPPPLVL